MIGLARGASIPFSTYKIQAKIAKNKSARASAVKILWNFGPKLEQGRQQAMATLTRTYGPARDANLALARSEIDRMAAKRPDLVDDLVRTGLGNSVYVVNALVALAKARGAR
jgi:hypothetical protein